MLDTIPQPPPAIINQHVHNDNNIFNKNNMDDAYLLAATIWGEARGDGEKGMHAVLNVILNRSGGDITKAAGVVIKPKQFSFWNKISDKLNFAKKLAQSNREGKLKDGKMYNKAIELVDKALQHQLEDITGGAKYYFNPSIVRPSWANKMLKTTTIGHHEFLK